MRPAAITLAALAVALASCGSCDGGPTTTFAKLSLAKDTSCGRTRDGRVLCWGDDAFRSMTMSADSVPAPLRARPTEVHGVRGARGLSIGASHGCALLAGGAVTCWEDFTSLSLEAPERLRTSAAVMAARPTSALAQAVQLSSSVNATCALTTSGAVTCHDFRENGPWRTPAFRGAASIAVGDMHVCGITRAKHVVCEGSSLVGALGGVPEDGGEVPGLDDVDALSAGSGYTCALRHGEVWCWGSNSEGQTGQPPTAGIMSTTPAPARVDGLPPAVAIAAGVYHSCAVLSDGQVRCWGDDRFGQLGEPNSAGNVHGVYDVVQVEVGEWHSCALKRDGTAWCWGRNQRGQLGDGSTTDTRAPVGVET